MTNRNDKSDIAARGVILRGIELPYKEPEEAAFDKASKLLSFVGLASSEYAVCRKSVDARKKNDIRFVYSVRALLSGLPRENQLKKINAILEEERAQPPRAGAQSLGGPVAVVGFGPCGMFAALALAKAGYAPVVIERGDGVYERSARVRHFLETGELDENCNVQFGAGGAGTFSDGKLMTRINDPLCREVIETFYAHGAPEEILTHARPHVGTDRLMPMVQSIEDEIVRLGGRFLYRTTLTGLSRKSDGSVNALKTSRGEIPCGAAILALGHSARDTYRMLMKTDIALVPKDFSVGARVEHLQSDIDRALYGEDADLSILGHAEYSLSVREGERGVYSFCMCPGGEVICSSSSAGKLVVNGMSNYKRDGVNANSAIAVSVLKKDYGQSPEKAIAFQEALETRAYEAAGGGFRAPIQTMGDFLSGVCRSKPRRIMPSFRSGKCVEVRDLHAILPPFVTSMMEKGFRSFERQIPGFSVSDALLTGVETRTSAPLRILRNAEYICPDCNNLYPAGEGAGYAGGITSAAVDGLRTAYALISRYALPEAANDCAAGVNDFSEKGT